MSGAYSLTQKKLRIRSKLRTSPQQVVVIQDGSDADPQGTIFANDGFSHGYTGPASFSGSGFGRMRFGLETLSCSSDGGKRLTFTVYDKVNFNSFGLNDGDVVEFWAAAGESLSPSGVFPSWHSANQVGPQVQYFHGVIDKIDDLREESTRGFRIHCVDPLTRADRIGVVRENNEGVTAPFIVFNVEDENDTDRFHAVKVYDPAASSPAAKYKYGWPDGDAQGKMTVGEILEYLQDSYRGELYARGCLNNPSDDLFDPAELATFTQVPPKIRWDQITFGEAVLRLIKQNIPDHEVRVDPRTLVWHIVPVFRDIVSADQTSVVSNADTTTLEVADASGFTTVGNGSSVRVHSATDRYKSEVAPIVAVNGNILTLETPLAYTYANGDRALPVFSESNRAPRVRLELNDAVQAPFSLDLGRTYTAVEICSFNETRETITVTPGGPDEHGVRLAPAFDPAYRANYIPSEHSERRDDPGSDRNEDGKPDGIIIDEVETINPGPDAYTRIYFSQEHSAYGADHHVVNGALGDAEWTGTALHILTRDGQATDISAQNLSAIITHFSEAGWMDGPANTIRRYRIDVDRDLVAVIPTLQDVVNDAMGDLFEMSSAERHKVANPNKRFAVDRFWRIESTTPDDNGRTIGAPECPPLATAPGYGGNVIQTDAIPQWRAQGAPRTFEEQVNYHGLNPTNPITGGWVMGFIIQPPKIPAGSEDFCKELPIAEPLVLPQIELQVERYTGVQICARYPEVGFAGIAELWHGHEETLRIPVSSFEHESQSDQFRLVAEEIWRRVSMPLFSGQVTYPGVERWLGMSDLGFAVNFGPGDTGFVNGAVTAQSRIFGFAQSIEYDLANLTTSISLDTADPVQAASQIRMFEQMFVSDTSQMRALEAALKAAQKRLDCLEARPKQPIQPPNLCEIPYNGKSAGVPAGRVKPKEILHGGGETALGVSHPGDNGSGNRGSAAFNPTCALERDYAGKAWAFRLGTGAMLGGSENGAMLDLDGSPVEPMSVGQYAVKLQAELAQALTGIDPVDLLPNVGAETATGSTTTVIELRDPIANDGRFNGGFLELDDIGDGVSRPRYTITSHTASAVTISPAMAEAAPASGRPVTLWVKRRPDLDATDFPGGGVPIMDEAGEWFVLNAGTFTSAEVLSGNTLTVKTPAVSPTFSLGATGASITIRGQVAFENVPTGIGGGGGGGTGGLNSRGSWVLAQTYLNGSQDVVEHNGSFYEALADHTAAAADEPGVGVSWATKWRRLARGLSSAEATKLAGVEAGADVTDAANVMDALDGFAEGSSSATLAAVDTSNLTIGLATTLVAGALDPNGRAKLDGVGIGADNTANSLNAAIAGIGDGADANSGEVVAGLTVPAATDTLAGALTAAGKVKLDKAPTTWTRSMTFGPWYQKFTGSAWSRISASEGNDGSPLTNFSNDASLTTIGHAVMLDAFAWADHWDPGEVVTAEVRFRKAGGGTGSDWQWKLHVKAVADGQNIETGEELLSETVTWTSAGSNDTHVVIDFGTLIAADELEGNETLWVYLELIDDDGASENMYPQMVVLRGTTK